MNEKKLELLKKRAAKKKSSEKRLDSVIEALEKVADKPIEVPPIEVPKPEVIVETDLSALEAIAEETKGAIEALGSKLPKGDTKALDDLKQEIKTLQNAFNGVIKAIQDDIYARYAFANGSSEASGQFMGFVSASGDWFIQRITTDAMNGQSSRFAVGKGDYSTAWGKHAALKYKLRSEVYIP